jgi:hypothetical protein
LEQNIKKCFQNSVFLPSVAVYSAHSLYWFCLLCGAFFLNFLLLQIEGKNVIFAFFVTKLIVSLPCKCRKSCYNSFIIGYENQKFTKNLNVGFSGLNNNMYNRIAFFCLVFLFHCESSFLGNIFKIQLTILPSKKVMRTFSYEGFFSIFYTVLMKP